MNKKLILKMATIMFAAMSFSALNGAKLATQATLFDPRYDRRFIRESIILCKKEIKLTRERINLIKTKISDKMQEILHLISIYKDKNPGMTTAYANLVNKFSVNNSSDKYLSTKKIIKELSNQNLRHLLKSVAEDDALTDSKAFDKINKNWSEILRTIDEIDPLLADLASERERERKKERRIECYRHLLSD